MTETITEPTTKLLVDEETGRVLIGDDLAYVSRRYCDTHSFIRVVSGARHDTIFAGPEAGRRARARQNAEGEAGLDAVEYTVTRETGGVLTLRRVP